MEVQASRSQVRSGIRTASGDPAWPIDEICSNAWPPLRQVLSGDWMIRLSGGFTRRANSVNPLGPGAGPLAPVLDLAAQLYAAAGQPLFVRLPDFLAPEQERLLEERGFTAEGHTLSLYRVLEGAAFATDAAITLEAAPSWTWLAARAALGSLSAEQAELYRRIVGRIALPAAFATCREEGRAVAMAYGVRQGPLMTIDSVFTDERARQRGHSRRTLEALLAWAQAGGATAACLQVEAENAPAIALYRKLGFTREVYRYHYRRAPRSP